MLQTMQTNLGTQLAESLAFKSSVYLQGVYDVVALKRDPETVVENRKLDYELLERWIKYMEKPTDKYKYKEAWQAMMKRTLAAAATRLEAAAGVAALKAAQLPVWERLHPATNRTSTHSCERASPRTGSACPANGRRTRAHTTNRK